MNYYVLDTETNGLKSMHHELIELSIIRCSDKNQITKIIKPVHPERSSPEALKITGRTVYDLRKGELALSVIERIENFLNEDGGDEKGRCFVAHNAPFDTRFMHAMWKESTRQVFPAMYWLCTQKLAREWAKKIGIVKPIVKLGNALKDAGLTAYAGAHNAKSDAQNAYLLFNKYKEAGLEYLDHIKHGPYVEISNNPAANLDDLDDL